MPWLDKNKAAHEIIAASLPHVAFDGWNINSLQRGAEEAGYTASDVARIFPQGRMQAVEAYFSLCNQAMRQALQSYDLSKMKIRERIFLAVKLYLNAHDNHKEAFRKAVTLLYLPIYFHKLLYYTAQTSDEIWYAIGDKSSDFSFYSKRISLAAIIIATTQYWLCDNSSENHASWEFLNRSIDNIMQIEKAKHNFRQFFFR